MRTLNLKPTDGPVQNYNAALRQFADLHAGYEQAKQYPLKCRENPKALLNWRVEKMKFSKG